jgi:chemotaxis protein MotB
MSEAPVIRPKKIIKKHGGHHGGAWKVAYADFVTAMMALFMVLWILSSGPEVKNSVAAYFTDPRGVPVIEPGRGDMGNVGVGVLKGAQSVSTGKGSGSGENFARPIDEQLEQTREEMRVMGRSIAQIIAEDPKLKELAEAVNVTLTEDGLRIEFGEDADTYFEAGSARPRPLLRYVLGLILPDIEKVGTPIIVEGHASSEGGSEEQNWRLSSERAMALRRELTDLGVAPERIPQVRAMGDRQPRVGLAPEDPRNRRVSILLTTKKLDEFKQNDAIEEFWGGDPLTAAAKYSEGKPDTGAGGQPMFVQPGVTPAPDTE